MPAFSWALKRRKVSYSKLTNQFIAVLLAFLVGITAVGFSIDLHFCKGDMKSLAIWGKAKSCHQSTAQQCPNHATAVMDADEENNCCNNESLFIQSNDDQQISQDQVISEQDAQDYELPLATADYTLYIQVYNDADFQHYKPPLISKDLPVLFASFLI